MKMNYWLVHTCHSACDVLISLPNKMTTFKGTDQMRHERNENDLLAGA